MRSLPSPRGPISEMLLAELARPPHPLSASDEVSVADPLADEDLHLALYLAYELHYRGLPGVDDGWEWDPGLLGFRARLEDAFLEGLTALIGPPGESARADEMDLALRAIADADDAPSLSRHIERDGTLE